MRLATTITPNEMLRQMKKSTIRMRNEPPDGPLLHFSVGACPAQPFVAGVRHAREQDGGVRDAKLEGFEAGDE
jgi:hypothetical protein